MSDLTGQNILICERRIGRFIVELQDALENRGATVVVVRDYEHAAERLEQFDFDCIVLGVLNEPAGALLDRFVPLKVVFYAAETTVASVVVVNLQQK